MDDLACPRCKTTKYRNPSLKLMVNVCGHALCDNCVELLFVKGAAACQECGVSLRRGNFRVQMFDDPHVEKEVDIRKKILKDYNKHEEDFETLRDYNDYLEEIEEIVFNLANNVDVENMKRKIEQYKKDNRTLIMKNKSRLTKDEEYLEELIDYEQHESVYRKQKAIEEQREELRMKTKKKEALIDELMFSDAPAGEILATHAAVQAKQPSEHVVEKETTVPLRPRPTTKFSTGIKFWQSDSFVPMPKKEEDSIVYKYEEVLRDLCGPRPPLYSDLGNDGYLENTRSTSEQEKAAGFLSNVACYRALEEALCGLYYCSNSCSPSSAGSQSMDIM